MNRRSCRALLSRVILPMAIATVAACTANPRVDSAPPSPATVFEPQLIAKGARLAAVGNCVGCHTAPRGKPYAGGRALDTPFGTIYGTNITPDVDTGIGQWSEAAFKRAMREGVDRAGNNLYPAFPYDHFRHVVDSDIDALYAFLMTREPVSARPPPNRLRFPFNVRPLISVWKSLYLDESPVPGEPGHGTEWNRGAYLVAGLGHCGACHTARNALGAEWRDVSLAGGDADGWHAPALNHSSPAPVPWSTDTLYTYLRGGLSDRHDVPAGPMASVVHELSGASDVDVRAMAVYIASLSGAATSTLPPSTGQSDATSEGSSSTITAASAGDGSATSIANSGAAIYFGACADCHDAGRNTHARGALELEYSTAIAIATPQNLIRIVLTGIAPPNGERGPWMPSFAGALTDAQLTELAIYLRERFSGRPPWRDIDRDVQQAKSAKTD